MRVWTVDHRLWVFDLREFDSLREIYAASRNRAAGALVGNFFTNKHLPGYAATTISMAPTLLLLGHGLPSAHAEAVAVLKMPPTPRGRVVGAKRIA